MLCPAFVGREHELEPLTTALDSAAAGHGQVVFVLGEAGIGKSRLLRELREAAEARGQLVFLGRAVPSDSPVPFRPLTEALLSGFRRTRLPDSPELHPFLPALGRLVPAWRRADLVDSIATNESPVVIAEALLRCLRAATSPHGCVIVLEDLHWADPETLSILEYLVDNIASEPIVCIATLRPELTGALELVHAARDRRAGLVLELSRLDDSQVADMARACLDMTALPEPIQRFLSSRADGLPFLVEELLAGLIASAALVHDGDGWLLRDDAVRIVPLTLAATVHKRLTSLNAASRAVVCGAAVLGRHFDWKLLGPIAGVDEQTLRAALLSLVGAQLLESEPDAEGGGFLFRHALTRDAVLREMLPSEKLAFAQRALSTLQGARPELPDTDCELAAELALHAEQPDRAAILLLRAGRRAFEQGALITAESTLERARKLTSDSRVAAEIEQVLVETLSMAGKVDAVFAVGHSLQARLASVAGTEVERARLHLRLGRAAVAAGQWTSVRQQLGEAGRILEGLPATTGELTVTRDVLSAQLAFGDGRLDDAVALAQRTFNAAEQEHLPELACESLDLLSRRWRLLDVNAAEAAAAQAQDIAERYGLSVWRIAALQQLGTLDLWNSLRLDRLTHAREAAAQTGALATVALIDRYLASTFLNRFMPREGLEAARRCVELARRFHLAIAPMALSVQAFAHAELGQREEMEHAIDAALALAPDDPDVAGHNWGAARATLSAVLDDWEQALRELDRSMAFVRRSPTAEAYPFRGMWALLRTLVDDDGEGARDEVRGSGAVVSSRNTIYLKYAEAVELGRRGRAEDAEQLLGEAEAMVGKLQGWEWFQHLVHRLIASAALAGGWGRPIEWLKAAIPFFDDSGQPRIATACRVLLRDAGAAVPRRGRGESEVPELLRVGGVTSREMDVLNLVTQGLSNREIGERLYLSPRTVERHVSNLLARVGARRRSELVAWVARQRSLTA